MNGTSMCIQCLTTTNRIMWVKWSERTYRLPYCPRCIPWRFINDRHNMISQFGRVEKANKTEKQD